MFKTIGKLFGNKPDPAPHSTSPKEQAAFEKGREVSRSQIAAIEAYVNERYEQVRSGYLAVIQKQLDSCRSQEEHSPMLLARIEYSLYLEHVQEARAKLKDEVRSVFSEWDKLNKEMGVEELIEQWLDQAMTEKFADLSIAGLTILTDNADILKTADDNWRRKFPDLAAAQPLD